MNEEMIQHIESYLEGQMDRQQLQAHAREAGVEDLDAEIEWVKNTQLAVEMSGLRTQLNAALPHHHQKEEARVQNLWLLKGLLATAAALFILVLIYLGVNSLDKSALYAQYEYKDPGLPLLMGQSDAYELYDALSYYSEGRYEVAEDKLKGIQPDFPTNDTLAYYLGASLLYQEKNQEARDILHPLVAADSSDFQERAEWLLVLTYLKEKNYEKAEIEMLPILPSEDHAFYPDARKLKDDLDKRLPYEDQQ